MRCRPRSLSTFAILGAGTLAAAMTAGESEPAPGAPCVQVENVFEFTVDSPVARVAPLFGAEREREWAGEQWAPRFVYPSPARDVPGEVFTIEHGGTRATWVNTALDLDRGHIQYVYVVPDAQAVLIDIRVEPVKSRPGRDRGSPGEPERTRVRVIYRRTALDPGLNDHVAAMGGHDAGAGKEWAAAIAACLGKRRAPGHSPGR